MNRFILYSGLVHCALFMGALTYMTQHQDEKTPSVQSVVELEVPTAGTKDIPATAETAQINELPELPMAPAPAPEANKAEVRERKIRANLPAAPAVPRIVERAEKITGSKIATTLPEKTTPSTQMEEAPVAMKPQVVRAETEDVPEMGSDIQSIVAAEEPAAEDNTLDKEAADDIDALAAKHIEQLKTESTQSMEASPAPAKAETAGSATSQKSGSPDGAALLGEAKGEAKALSEFKQKAGNNRPSYDEQDRREGRAGLVVFLAYINNGGSLQDFQLLSSSGHRTLDLKTLKALRNWKFQPGQEGWVEMPFQWDLKGGVQEAPSTLRRISRGQ